jgi:drug/metabolite transporter (DMT)-like permease
MTVVILWALNPVMAKWFLLHGMTPLSLVTIRFLTFFGYTGVAYVLWRMFSKTKYTPVPGLTLLTALPAAGLMGMSFFNYFALTGMPPSLHLTILRLNTLLIPIVIAQRRGSLFKRSSMFTFVLFALLLILTVTIPGAPKLSGLILSLLALFSYTFYSLISEHVLRQKQISLRYPLFALNLGLILGVAGLLLLPLQASTDILNVHTLPAVLYILTCVCVPHMLYSFLLRRVSFTNFTDMFLLEVPFAIGFEVLLIGFLPLPLYIVMGLTLGILLLRRLKNASMQTL